MCRTLLEVAKPAEGEEDEDDGEEETYARETDASLM